MPRRSYAGFSPATPRFTRVITVLAAIIVIIHAFLRQSRFYVVDEFIGHTGQPIVPHSASVTVYTPNYRTGRQEDKHSTNWKCNNIAAVDSTVL